VHPLPFWILFTLLGVVCQRLAPGVDFLAPGLVICLQERRGTSVVWLTLAFILLQEGVGSLAFGSMLLWYLALLLFYGLGRWLFESRNILFVFFLGLVMAAFRVPLLRVMGSLQDLTPAPGPLIIQGAVQTFVFVLEWRVAYFLYKRLVRYEDDSRS
jgi:hypothetical protein